MLLSRYDEPARAYGGAALLLATALLLAGCSSTSSNGATEGTSFTSRISNLFSSPRGTALQPAPGETSASDYDCPGVDVRRGAGVLNVAAKSGDATAGDLRYQLSIRQTARECSVQAGTMVIKVGVQGRIILGPYGTPGSVDVPLRYAVVREGPQPRPIMTKFKRLSVTVPPGETNLEFTDIEEGLAFPIPPGIELSTYLVYVGFDEIGDPKEKRPARTAKKKRAR
jgi:hypothetical protein